MFWLISSWDIIINEFVNISVHFCWTDIFSFFRFLSQSFEWFWIWAIWSWSYCWMFWLISSWDIIINEFIYITIDFSWTNIFNFFSFLSQGFEWFWIWSIWSWRNGWMFNFISSWNIVINEFVNISVHFCWSNILLFGQSFVWFWVRSIWKIWNFTFFCWKGFNNTCNKSMNFFINSLFTNIWLFLILFLFCESFMRFWIGSIWKIRNFRFLCWKWFYDTCYESVNFLVASFFTNVTFFWILFFFWKCFMWFWVRSIWKIWNLTLFSWKGLYNASYEPMNFFVASLFSNITFFRILFFFS